MVEFHWAMHVLENILFDIGKRMIKLGAGGVNFAVYGINQLPQATLLFAVKFESQAW